MGETPVPPNHPGSQRTPQDRIREPEGRQGNTGNFTGRDKPHGGFLPLITVAALVALSGVAGFFVGRHLRWQHLITASFREYD